MSGGKLPPDWLTDETPEEFEEEAKRKQNRLESAKWWEDYNAQRRRRKEYIATLSPEEQERINSEDAERFLGLHRISEATRATAIHSQRLVRLTFWLVVLTCVLIGSSVALAVLTVLAFHP